MAEDQKAPEAAAEEKKTDETAAAPAEEKKAAPKKKGPKTTESAKKGLSRRTLRANARRALKEKLQNDKEYAKKYFDGRSKRSSEKKVAFRKRHAKA